MKQLSEKEKLILKRLGEGANTKRVAGEVGLTHKSLYTYLFRIKRKLGVDSTAAAIVRVAELEAQAQARHVEAAREGALNP